MTKDYYPGEGCTCAARSESECCCEVDWSDPEVYTLRRKVEQLEADNTVLREALTTLHDYDFEGMDGVGLKQTLRIR